MELSDGLIVLRVLKEDVGNNVENDGLIFLTHKSKKAIGQLLNRI